MITVAALDPASLTLWYDPAFFHQREPLARAATKALYGKVDEVVSIIGKTPAGPDRESALQIASTIWHEQRHFLDLVLTNYGARRIQHFMRVFANLRAIISVQRERRLFFPFHAYGDPVRRAIHGLESDDQIAKLAVMFSEQDDWLAFDRRKIVGLEIGGHAQLEAVAFDCQRAAAGAIAGLDGVEAVERMLGRLPQNQNAYLWPSVLAKHLGIHVPIASVAWVAVLVGAMMISRSPARTGASSSRPATSDFPGPRLMALLTWIRDKGRTWPASALDAWELVNEAALDLWGLTCIDEFARDLDSEGGYVERLVVRGAPPDIVEAYASYHDLRKRVYDQLIMSPESFLCPFGFFDRALSRVRPLPVILSPDGREGDPPDGYDYLWAQIETREEARERNWWQERVDRVRKFINRVPAKSDIRWWWAAIPSRWPTSTNSRDIALPRSDSWIRIAWDYAPLAKLVLNGRRHRTMVGPELFFAEMQLEKAGFTIRFDPMFGSPAQLIASAAPAFEIVGVDEFKCDLCHDRIPSPKGFIVSPWAFRLLPDLGDMVIELLGGGEKGAKRIRRDWSVWIVCGECFVKIPADGRIG